MWAYNCTDFAIRDTGNGVRGRCCGRPLSTRFRATGVVWHAWVRSGRQVRRILMGCLLTVLIYASTYIVHRYGCIEY